jgi:8-oxo-(d)GTP phosphatase
MADRMTEPRIRAAGAVLWLPTDPKIPIAVVHRPRYNDWSLPKGKLQPGEHALEAAVREVREETGYAGVAGRRLPTVGYLSRAGPKCVEYWAMRANGGQFTAGAEVDMLEWLPAETALDMLTYDHDTEVVRGFVGTTVDALVLLVRHAAAGDRASWTGRDKLRPLDQEGTGQAERLAEVLPLFGPGRVVAADLNRCVQTVQPLAHRLSADVEIVPALSEHAHDDDRSRGAAAVRELAAPGQTVVACGQGGAIPDAIAILAGEAGLPLPDIKTAKGSTWALSFLDGRLVAADYYPSFGPWEAAGQPRVSIHDQL